jgi:hypothetical protein
MPRLAWALSFAAGAGLHAQPVEFNRDVRPILSDRCFTCHGPDAANRKVPLRLDVEDGARKAISPGNPPDSKLYQRITSDNKTLRMPPAYAGHARLSDGEIAALRRWIEQGAPWQKHWSLVTPSRPEPPAVQAKDWVRNPIDHFVLSRLEREGLAPRQEANRRTLIRRVSFDLTGLPPTPEQVEAFVADTAPDAYEKVVNRLLASPRYAERMAFRWMEVARYADTNGYQSDGPRDMWRWRDWVIDAYHSNMPFDQFTIEQLAGDLLPHATLSQKIATGFNRNHRTSAEGGVIDEELRVEYVADRTETTATVWMGMTLGCARCHDHKYDPLPQRDYYRMFSFFNNVPERGFVYNFGNEPPYIKAPRPAEQAKLAELDARVAEAGRRVEAQKQAWVREQARWEKTLAHGGPKDWEPSRGLAYSWPGPETFDGKGFVDAGDHVAKFNYLDPFTFAAWIKPESPNGAILSKNQDYFEGAGHGLYLIEGRLRLHVIFRWTDLGMRMESAGKLKMGEWQHVAVTYDGKMKASGVRMYVNGEPQDIRVLFDQNLWPLEPKVPFRIGAGGGMRFDGAIRAVRVFDRALTVEEAAALSVPEPLPQIAAMRQRSPAQAHKLRLAYLDLRSPPELAALAGARAEREKYYAAIPTVMVMAESDWPRAAYVLKRGAYDAPGDRVSAGVPGALPPLDPSLPPNRLGLARWLVSRGHPLTARVTVNRHWQMLFGVGLVRTVEDFGSQGEWPLHLGLLDWLAVEFMESGWDVKRLLRTIVTSATYRQDSAAPAALVARDPENRLLARGARFRLSADMVRDQALAVSGLLVEKIGGPPVRPYQPPGLWQELTSFSKEYQRDSGENLYRRSLYTYWKRTVAPPSMTTFDSPSREVCTVRATRTNTPLQALNTMNDVTYLEAARKLAERMMTGAAGKAEAALDRGFALVFGREPKPYEREAAMKLYATLLAGYRKDRAAAVKYLSQGDSPRSEKLDAAELAAWSGVASLLLNLDEALTRE